MTEASRCLDSHLQFLGNNEPSNFGLKAQNIWHTLFEEGILKNSSVLFWQSSATAFLCDLHLQFRRSTVYSHREDTYLAKCAGCLSVCCMEEPCLCTQQAPGSQEVMLVFFFNLFFSFLPPPQISQSLPPFWPTIAAIILEHPAPI